VFDTVYRNLNVATMKEGETPYGALRDAAIGIKDGRLAFVGAESHLPANHSAGEIIDCAGEWALPGFVDCHTHLVFGGNRAAEFEMRMHGASYEEIARAGGGILSTVKATRAASTEDLAANATKRLKQLKADGVTTVEIKSGYGLTLDDEMKMLEAAKQAADACGVGLSRTFLGAHALPPEFAGNSAGYIEHICTVMIPAIAEAGVADAVDAFCEGIGFSADETRQVFEAAKAHGLKIKLHAEQLSDLGGAALAAEFGALSADHLEYVNADGVKAMGEAGTVAVLLPGAFYTLGETKRPPVEMMRSKGVDMALATDMNPGSSPVGSLQLMLHMGCTLFGMTAEEALAGITRNGAKALGLSDRGTLEVGKRADLVFFDIESPAELAYWVGGQPLTRMVIGGNPA
jgi:imidazolonepropionase